MALSGDLIIRLADAEDALRWRAFIDARAEATLFHDLRWVDAVSETYGYQSRSLIAERGGGVVGVLPLTLVAAPLLGRSLISTAFSVGGGALGENASVIERLAAKAKEIGHAEKVRYVELRGGEGPPGWIKKDDVYAAFSKELPAETGAIKAWLPRNRRAEIKKAQRIKEDPAFRFTPDGDIDLFYDVYAGAVKRLGTPVMPRRFLHALKGRFGADAEASLVLTKGKPVAGLFTFWRGDRVMPYFIGGTAAARDIRAYDYLYYMLMKRAVERGVRIFDFGRSKVGSPHFNTKKYWGFDPQPLTYHFALVNAEETPNVNPKNPKFAAFVGLWKHLPTPVANVVGPMLARNFA